MTDVQIPMEFWLDDNPMYHPNKPPLIIDKYDSVKFDSENHHDHDKLNIYHEGEELPGRE